MTVLDLQPDWGIQQVYPNPDDSDYKTLDPESDDVIPFQASLPLAIMQEKTFSRSLVHLNQLTSDG